MSIGIYISGLGQSTAKETAEKYASRYLKELEYSTSGFEFYTKIEKIYYLEENSSLAIRILQKPKGQLTAPTDPVLYTFYDFQYSQLLTEKFEQRNLILKNLFLLILVIRKIPALFRNIFNLNTFIKTKQTFYVFGIFLLMSFAVIWLIPSVLSLFQNEISKYFNLDGNLFTTLVSISAITVPVTAIIILLIPESSTLVTKLATEFTAVDNYIQYGEQSQTIQGNLDALVEYIVENEPNPTIQFHTYSFGSIVAMDALFPIGNDVTYNTKETINLLITVGAPFEFVKGFYPNFYENRNTFMTEKIQWVNVYSLMDAFASNFRNDNKAGNAHFGIIKNKEKPINLNYEIARKDTYNPFNFLTLKHIRMHRCYWDETKNGQSCTRLIFNKMKEMGFWK
ncbi:MAG: hypothetical protein J0L86_05520 [Flavobacteriales bacterium]|nr:hypothetical protein [Flavobacteriales bacterium]